MAAFGPISNPLDQVGSTYGSVNVGLPKLISNISSTIIIVGGLFAFFNLLIAGITYITANGDTKKIENAVYSINMSLLGLLILVGASAIAGIVGYIFFNDAGAILKPSIYGPGNF
jgi:hypothetical protein